MFPLGVAESEFNASARRTCLQRLGLTASRWASVPAPTPVVTVSCGMVATTAPTADTDVLLVDLAIGLGYNFAARQWRSRAACRGSDPAWWHPQRGTSLEPHRAICRGCEVRLECLTYALAGGATQDGGIWAGSSARQRRVAKRRGWDAARLLAELDRDSSLKRRTVGA